MPVTATNQTTLEAFDAISEKVSDSLWLLDPPPDQSEQWVTDWLDDDTPTDADTLHIDQYADVRNVAQRALNDRDWALLERIAARLATVTPYAANYTAAGLGEPYATTWAAFDV